MPIEINSIPIMKAVRELNPEVRHSPMQHEGIPGIQFQAA